MRYRELLSALLSVLLLAGPSSFAQQIAAVAGPSKATTTKGAEVTQGTNVFNGDVVDVSQGGETVLLFGHNALVRLNSDSTARLFKCGGNSTVQVLRGRVVFRSTPQQSVEAQIGDAVIRPPAGQEGIGVVAVTTPNTVSITAQKGSFTVTTAHDNKSLLVHEGETTEAKLATPASATPNPPICGVKAAVASQPSTTLWVILGAGAAAAAGAGLATGARSLTCAQKGALVSPYQFPCP